MRPRPSPAHWAWIEPGAAAQAVIKANRGWTSRLRARWWQSYCGRIGARARDVLNLEWEPRFKAQRTPPPPAGTGVALLSHARVRSVLPLQHRRDDATCAAAQSGLQGEWRVTRPSRSRPRRWRLRAWRNWLAVGRSRAGETSKVTLHVVVSCEHRRGRYRPRALRTRPPGKPRAGAEELEVSRSRRCSRAPPIDGRRVGGEFLRTLEAGPSGRPRRASSGREETHQGSARGRSGGKR